VEGLQGGEGVNIGLQVVPACASGEHFAPSSCRACTIQCTTCLSISNVI